MNQASDNRHSLAQTIGFHFIPGVVITIAFVILARLGSTLNLPPSLALLVTWLVVGVPVLLGILYREGRKRNGAPSLEGILLYREPMPLREYLWLVPVLLVWSALASTLLFPLGESIRHALFAWMPEWLNLSALAQNPKQYGSAVLWTIVGLSAVLNIAIPIIEELYFRSFLMPRIPASAKWIPLLSAALFSLYHFWLPSDTVGRIITLLPVLYAVQWKRNVTLSILVHVLLNLLGTLGLAAVVMGVI